MSIGLVYNKIKEYEQALKYFNQVQTIY